MINIVVNDDTNDNGLLDYSGSFDITNEEELDLTLSGNRKYIITLTTTDGDYIYFYPSVEDESDDAKYSWEAFYDNFAYIWNDNTEEEEYLIFANGEEDVTYHFVVDNPSDESTTVNINIEEVVNENDDAGDFIDDALEISFDNSTTIDGRIDNEYDRDFYKVNLEQGTTYIIEVNTQNVDDALEDSMVYIYDENGNFVTMDDDGGAGLDSMLLFTPEKSGTYYIEVRPYSYGNDDYTTGNYQLNISNASDYDDDYGNTIEDAEVISVDSSIEGSIEVSYDEDYFALQTTSEEIYNITLTSQNSSDFYPYIDVYNENGEDVWDGIYWNYTDGGVTLTLRGDGNTYYLGISSYGETGDYTISVSSEELQSDGNDTIDEAEEIALDSPIVSSIDPSYDRDYYAIDLTAGESYIIEVNTQNVDNPLNDSIVYVYDENGNFVTMDDDGGAGLDSMLLFTPAESGTYYIDVESFSNAYTGNYELKVYSSDYNDDYGNTIEDAEVINVDSTIDGSIEVSYDEDYFALQTTSGETYNITITPQDSDFYPYVNVYDENGNYVWDGIDWEYDYTKHSITLTAIGNDSTYYLEVSGYGDIGSYTINVNSEELQSDGNDSITEAVNLPLNEIESENIGNVFDQDYYAINVNAGTSYIIDVDSDNGYVWADILDENGDYVWDGVSYDWTYDIDTQITFTPTQSGTYYVRVAGEEGSDYTITYFGNIDDYPNTIYDQNIETLTDSISGRFETNYDVDVFKLDVTANRVYELTLDSDDAYGYIEVVDENGYYVDVDWEWNDDVVDQVSFVANEDTTYYVLLDGYDTGTYTLDVNTFDIEQDDHPNTISEVTDNDILNVDETLEGAIEISSDSDIFALDMSAGNTYKVTLTPTNNDSWGYVDILDENGDYVWNNVYWDWDSDTNSEIVYITPSEDTTYYASVEGSRGLDYQISLTQVSDANDDHPNSISGNFDENDILTDGMTLDGNIDNTFDIDYFEINAQSGTTYQITLSSNSYSVWGDIVDNNGYYLWDASYDFNYDYLNDTNESIITFTADEDASYYFYVNSYDENVTYNVTLREVSGGNDNEGNTIQTAANAIVGENDGSIDYYGDTDYFAVTLDEGVTYDVSLSGLDWGYLDIEDEDGYFVWDDVFWTYSEQNNDEFYITPEETQTYYISVNGSIGDYTLNINEVNITSDEIGDTIDSAEILTENSVDGTIDNIVDIDMYAYTFEANHTYEITIDSNDDNFYPWVNILNANGDYEWNVDYTFDDNDYNMVTITFTPLSTQTYYLEVDGYGQTGEYNLSINDVTTTEISNDVSADASTIANVTVDGTYIGELETYNDVDWIKLEIDETGVYKIDLTSDEFDTLIDGVYDSEGNYISGTWDDDGGVGLNSETFLNATAGTYYVAVTSYAGVGLGEYTLEVSKSNITDPEANNPNTNASVTLNQPYNGEINYAYDEDWIAINNLEANTTYTVTLTGDTLSDTVINGVYNNMAQLLPNTYNDDYGFSLDSQVTFTTTDDGTYYISVSGFDSEIGTYTLSVLPGENQNSINDISDNIDNAQEISIGDVINNQLDEAGDHDYFAVNLVAGQTYEFDVYGYASGEGTLVDSTLQILDSNGNEVAYNDDNGSTLESSILFTPDSSGTYYLNVGSYADEYEGSYVLQTSQIAQNVDITPISNQANNGSWTIMMYIDGDNNLEGFALDDLEEMISANLPDNVNVTFILDRTDGYSTANGDWSGTKEGVIVGSQEYNSINDIPMQDLGELNMGDQQTLTDFINWSYQIAPADNYALVIWDHGGIVVNGDVAGSAWDDTNLDYLTLDEVRDGILQSNVDHVDMVGFDACLQGVADTYTTLANVTDYVVASEETEPGDGWDYEAWFNSLDQNNDGVIDSLEVATSAVESFEDSYEYSPFTTTLASIDTSKVDDFVSTFKEFNDALVNLSDSDKMKIQAALNDTLKFDSPYNDYFDLRDFIENLQESGVNVANENGDDLDQELINVIEEMVVASTNNIDVTNEESGISIYYPGVMDNDYLQNDFAQAVDLDNLYNVLLG